MIPTRLRAGTAILLAAAAMLADGCACDSVPDGAITDCSVSPPVPQAVRTDILFVIDDSGSMGEEQTNLQTNLDTFIQGLKDSPVANDFQVGVTTTSVTGWTGGSSGEAGRLVGTPGVLVGSSATFVSDFQARVAAVGTGGSGKEQGLLAMRRALSAPLIEVGGVNEGFLRQGARLAVVFLSDEDDCSDSVSPWADNNNKCHNYAGDGIDYKATVMDPIADYVTFLTDPTGPVGAQEARDVVLASIAGVDSATKLPTCDYTTVYDPNGWCCGSADFQCLASDPAVCGTHAVTVPGGLTGETYCCNETAADACHTTCPNAYDKADRYMAMLAAFEAARPGKTLAASICDASFANTLTQIACMLVPQDVPIDGAPEDWRMMTVALTGGASTVGCRVALDGSADAAAADVVYSPPSGDLPAVLHFQNACRLGCGKRIEINLICAG